MTIFHSAQRGSAGDRVFGALLAGLDIEFGEGAGEALAQHYLDAEERDFLWDARIDERWLGSCEDEEDADAQYDRVAVIGRLQGTWYTAVSIVDGEGRAQDLIARRDWESERSAREAWSGLG